VTKVLYIEHDDDNLYMLKMRLEQCRDFKVFAAEDKREGLQDGRDFYKLTADNGGAPCVRYGLLSLAICKPMIRKTARDCCRRKSAAARPSWQS
jgi:hypothetical protein